VSSLGEDPAPRPGRPPAPPPAPGTRWVRRVGKHEGAEIEVDHTTETSVFFRNLGGGDAMGNQKVDPSQVHHVTLGSFKVLYRTKPRAEATGVGHAFRQNNQRSRQMTLEPAEEVAEPVAPPTRDGQHHIHAGDSGLGISVELITPELAQTWLDRGGVNRKPSERAIMKLVHAINLGEWDLTGETIKLDKEGRVRDGQHRLQAIIRSGKAVQCIVVRGIPESAFDKIDTGKSRNMADVLSIHGHIQSTALATAARGLMLIENHGRLSVGGARIGSVPAPSNAQGLAYIEAHPEVEEAIHLADSIRVTGGFVGGTGLWAIPITMFLRVNPEQARVFVRSLVEGASLEHGNPILRLRNMYQGRTREWAGTNENRERLVAITIKAWNFWRRDELVQVLTWHSQGRNAEKFPVAE
jgi:hypothetical protein